jgi:hypothetical protein
MTASDRAHDCQFALPLKILRLRWLIAAEHFQLCFARSVPPTEELRLKCRQLEWSLAARRFQLAFARHAEAVIKAGFNPDQPRVPAGNPEGGQWTRDGTVPARVRLADASPVISPGPVMSDASPDPIRPGAQYAAGPTQITIHASALTGISTIDDTTKRLVSTLATVMDTVDYLPGLRPQEYGKLVHYAFAAAVRAGNFPGIGFFDVETTFGPDLDARYGSKGSIRTDVVLRKSAWQQAIDLDCFDLQLSTETPFESLTGYLQAWSSGKRTGFECDHWTVGDVIETYPNIDFGHPWSFALAFRWIGDLTEMHAAWMAAAAYADAGAASCSIRRRGRC